MNTIGDKIRLFWLRNSSAFMRLLMINIVFSLAVWIVVKMTSPSFFTFITVPDSFAALVTKPYTLITYMFAHSGFRHLLMNMIVLYFVGSVFEDFLGRNRTFQVYLASGLIGALAYILILSGAKGMVGASGAVMGLLYGLTVLRPNYEFFLYGLIKLKLWWITVAYAAFDLFAILGSAKNLGGHICHVAGGLTGAVLVMYWTGKFSDYFNRKKDERTFSPFKVTVNPNPIKRTTPAAKPNRSHTVPSQEEIDFILDKINESGYDNLSQAEKETLFRAKDIKV